MIAVVNSESEKGTSRSSLGDGTGIIGTGEGEVRLAYGKKALRFLLLLLALL